MRKLTYEDFKRIFTREDGTRKNGVILRLMKDKAVREYLKDSPYRDDILGADNPATFFELCNKLIAGTSEGDRYVEILGVTFKNDTYYSDASRGVCVDGDPRSYRYRNAERGHSVYKMKIGKLYSKLVMASPFGRVLPASVILFLCEELTSRWATYNSELGSKYKLHVDDDFSRIYSSDYCSGDFGSCMVDDGYYTFYEDAVKASAAYLTDEDGLVVARCVIYNKAIDSNGRVWRLAERQYASDGDEVLKRLLVAALIKGDHIDAYKKVGAGCHDPLLWVDKEGNLLSDPKFKIRCLLENGDTVSYQDSFKWYDVKKYTAYNYHEDDSVECLQTTDGQFYSNYDEYHDEYTSSDVIAVYYNGSRITCAEDRLDDFCEINGRWYHYEDTSECPECGERFVCDDGFYSELTSECYCCADCMDQGEERYTEE